MSVKCRVIEGGYCEITQDYKKGVHNGIDLVGVNYTLAWITAHSDGTVVAYRNDCNSFESGSYGNYVKIRHNDGYYTLYGHMAYKSVKVKTGDKVKKGQIIGYMGNTGESYGGHLHWEVRNTTDARIDPTPYLDKDLPNTDSQVNVFYRVKTKDYGWLPEVENLNDYAGWNDSPITALAIKVDKGSLWYQAHVKGGEWLPKVTGYNIKDFNNGYAGDGREIDAIRIYYYTPNNIRPYKKAKYKVNDYAWQYDDEYDKNGENYAGIYGVTALKIQIEIK